MSETEREKVIEECAMALERYARRLEGLAIDTALDYRSKQYAQRTIAVLNAAEIVRELKSERASAVRQMVDEAEARYRAMPAEEQAEMWRRQRESWARQDMD